MDSGNKRGEGAIRGGEIITRRHLGVFTTEGTLSQSIPLRPVASHRRLQGEVLVSVGVLEADPRAPIAGAAVAPLLTTWGASYHPANPFLP